jgi:hypothetical protein
VILTLLALLLSVCITVSWLRPATATRATPEPTASSERSASASVSRYAHIVRHNSAPEESPHGKDLRELRGAGYIWGNALKGIYANGTITAEGKRHLNVTEISRSRKHFHRPVDLEDASVTPEKRAEYLAAVITAALNLHGREQPGFARILEHYYTRDLSLRQLEHGGQNADRAELSAEARKELLALVPPYAGASFQEVFPSDFLFRSMSVAAEQITIEQDYGNIVVGSGALLSFAPDGAISIQAGSVSHKPKQSP